MGELDLVILLVGGVIAVVSVGFALHQYREKKRTEALTAAAERLGLQFAATGDPNLQARMSGFSLFSQGRARKVKNVVLGETNELRLAIFDYQYTTGNGKNAHTHKMTVAAIESSQLQIPGFTLRPENLFDKIGAALGGKDIDFTTQPVFSSAFVLKSADEPAVRELFDQSILDYFASHRGISAEGQPGKMILYRSGKRIKPEATRQMLTLAYEIFGHFADRPKRKK